MVKAERVEYLDALKGLCIFMVVFYHDVVLSDETVLGNIAMAWAWFSVPCFMMISGGLMHAAPSFSWKKYGKKVAKIYFMMCAWRLIYFIVYSQIADVSASKTEFIQYVLFLTDLESVRTGIMWYMLAFLIALMLYPVSHFLFRSGENGRKILLFLTAVAFFSGIILRTSVSVLSGLAKLLHCSSLSISDLVRIMPLTNYANMLVYFWLGAFLYEYRQEIAERLAGRRYVAILLTLAGTAGLLLIKFAQTGSFAWEGVDFIDANRRVSTVLLSVGVYLTFALYDLKAVGHFLAVYVGRYTMGIYYIHIMVLSVWGIYLYPQLTSLYSFWLNCAKTIVCCFVCWLLTVALRKCPVLRELVK